MAAIFQCLISRVQFSDIYCVVMMDDQSSGVKCEFSENQCDEIKWEDVYVTDEPSELDRYWLEHDNRFDQNYPQNVSSTVLNPTNALPAVVSVSENIPVEVSIDPTFKCDECQFTAWRSSYIAKHKKRNHGAPRERIKCDQCDKSLLPKSMTFHKQRMHGAPCERYKCDQCEYTSLDKQSMTFHKQRNHGAPRERIKCDQCDKSLLPKSMT
ncbi:MAG: hypothetical protein GY818_20150, partial [Planctomycetaceae bacterium]|nr:hypothetical protein [Planctomycetaceae bacterium]